MAELVRKIEENDIPQLKNLSLEVFGDDRWSEIERLGGMTNRSYKITRENSKSYVFRIPGDGTEELINRQDEKKSTELACELEIDARLLFFSDDGRKVMDYISDPQPMNDEILKKKEILIQAANIFKRLHKSGVDTGVRFEVFEMAELYEKIIHESGTPLYDDYESIKRIVIGIKSEMDSVNGVKRVPCHNDSLVDNWVLDGQGRLYLIDWEYSGMNEPMWDLSCLSIEANYKDEDDNNLLEAYYGRPPRLDERKWFIAAKLYVDYLWTLWGLTRVQFDGEYMEEYALMRYKRLKKNIEEYYEEGERKI